MPIDACPSRIYCVSCRTGYEAAVATQIAAYCRCRALAMRKMKREMRNGQWVTREIVALPGYLFLYADDTIDPQRVLRVPGTFQFLRYDDGGIDLRGDDRAFAQWLLAQGGVLGLSSALREGDRVVMIDGPLKELGGRILRVDKRKRIAQVAIRAAQAERHIWLSFDWLKAEVG
ncbi:MAG: hypothetical protein GX558_07070 [Clostridiales bacterium]|nr:hypothetical protein [Clostridiales bacterium]